MNKIKEFRIFFSYIKEDKLKFSFYVFLVFLAYLPDIMGPFFWSQAVAGLISHNLSMFGMYILLYNSSYIFAFSIVQIPRDQLFKYFDIKFAKNASKDLFRKINSLPAVAFEEIGVGEFINRLSSDTDRIMSLLSSLIRMLGRIIVAIIVMVIVFSFSWILGLQLVVMGIVMGFMANYYYPKIKESEEQIKKESDKCVKDETEYIEGIREIKALGIKKNVQKRINQVLDNLFKHTEKSNTYSFWYYGLNNAIYFVIQGLIFFTCGKLYFDNILSINLFFMLQTYIWKVDSLVESISEVGVNYNKVTVSLKRINEIIDNKLYPDEVFGREMLVNCQGMIKFDQVKFKYRDNEDYILKGLNLNIEPNKKIAIVGRSGNGKSTMFNLLARYYDASEGVISIDGINIKDLSEESLRSNISIIRQDPFLFNATIMDNFRLVKEDVSLEEVRQVCKKAYIDDYIMSLPHTYETIIGEGGINLSGGQKQRLAIARTLLLNGKIILFDEATSALDNESQEVIKKTINELVKDHTVVIIAHRLSTIVDANQINVIDHGELVGQGTHKELLKNCLEYQSLYLSESDHLIEGRD